MIAPLGPLAELSLVRKKPVMKKHPSCAKCSSFPTAQQALPSTSAPTAQPHQQHSRTAAAPQNRTARDVAEQQPLTATV